MKPQGSLPCSKEPAAGLYPEPENSVHTPPYFPKISFNIVTSWLKARIVEPEQTSVAEHRLGNHVPATTNSNERVVARLEVVNT
jgi:hypothetical protein